MKKIIVLLFLSLILSSSSSPVEGEEKWFLNETNVTFVETEAGCELTSPGWKGRWDSEAQKWIWISGGWRTTAICPSGQCGCSNPLIIDPLTPKCGDSQLFFGEFREYLHAGETRVDQYIWVGIYNCQTNSWMETSGDWVPKRIGKITL